MEKLYNNINMPEEITASDANNVPYLKNPPEIIDISVGRQLFVDNFLIEETTLTPEYHKAKKYTGNPVLLPETEWEKERLPAACPKSGGVWYDEQDKVFKMWYEASWLRHMCYAESKDGINRLRPDLGFEKGTNKILLYDGFDEMNFFGGDGFVSMNGNGTLLTRKLEYMDKTELYINADGKVSVEVITADGTTLAISKPFEGNSTKAKIIFEDFDVCSLNNTVFRLKFNVCGKIYSFGFTDKNGDFGGAHAAGIVENEEI